MDVSLIAHTPEPDIIAAAAARLTHENTDFQNLLNKDKATLNAVLKHVVEMGHESVVEHVSFTFAISGVSRALTHQLVRHRIASYSQQSQRYIEQDPYYIIPPSIKKNHYANRYNKIMKEIWEFYEELKNTIPIEDARYILPNATCSRILVTMNARSLLNFFRVRCCLHAQWEIRILAWKMLKLVRNTAPTIFKNAGPPCKSCNICPELDKSCRWYIKYIKNDGDGSQ